MALEKRELKSLLIDREGNRYELNGETMDGVSKLYLEFDNGEWTLSITKTEKYQTPPAENPERPQWRRFELLAGDEAERTRLEKVLDEHNLSKQDLAVILFGLRVRPEFGKKDFGI